MKYLLILGLLFAPTFAFAHTADLTGLATCVDTNGDFDITWELDLQNSALDATANGSLGALFTGTLPGNSMHQETHTVNSTTTLAGDVVWTDGFIVSLSETVDVPAACAVVPPPATTTPPSTPPDDDDDRRHNGGSSRPIPCTDTRTTFCKPQDVERVEVVGAAPMYEFVPLNVMPVTGYGWSELWRDVLSFFTGR